MKGGARSARGLSPLCPAAIILAFVTALLVLATRPAAAQASPGVSSTAIQPAAATAAPARPCPALDGVAVEEEGPEGAQVDVPLRSVPSVGASDENFEINSRSAWRWHRLTYPSGRLPYRPLTRAMRWVRENVCEAAPWAHDGEAGRLTPEGTLAVGSGSWTPLGPRPLDMTTYDPAGYSYDYGRVTGRFDAVAIDPRTADNPDGSIRAFAGAASGGLWRSTNCCGTDTVWEPLWEGFLTPTQACGAIELDPNDPDTIYAGTGSFDAYDQHSEGLMKSADGGDTWTQLGADVFVPTAPGTPLWQNQAIGAIRVDPNDSNTVLVGTRFELFISHDAGQTWSRCLFGANPTDPTHLGNPFKSIHRITGILLDPSTHPTTLYVAVGYEFGSANGDNGVYKGVVPATGTPTLTLVSTPSSGWPAGTGSGTQGASAVGRMRLASSRGNAEGNFVIYAQVSSTAVIPGLGTWVSMDQGATWRQLAGSLDDNYKNCYGLNTYESQDWYDLFLLADPADDKALTIGRVGLFRARVDATYSHMTLADIGSVYDRRPACPGFGKVHCDQHGAAWIGRSGRFLLGNDGGLYSADGTLGGFTQLNDTLNATQWYAGQISANFGGGAAQYLLAGSQDNGSASWDSSRSDLAWQGRTGGDGFYAAFDPLQASLSSGRAYAELYFGALFCSSGGVGATRWTHCPGPWETNEYSGWNTPFKVDFRHCADSHCDNMILGATHLWASASGGDPVWVRAGATDLTKGSGTASSLDVAPSNPASVVVGTDDGNVQWSNTVFTGTACTQAAANTSGFACSPNAGANWVDLTGSNAILPNRVVTSVAFDPTTDQRLYATLAAFNETTPSTSGHLFMAECPGGCTTASNWSWTDKTGNLPDVPAESVVVNPNAPRQVFVGTELGFYYTDDITHSPPVWMRYSHGLPNTVITYLALDRGPQAAPYTSTTIVAFTYGRGAYAIRLPSPGGFENLEAAAAADRREGAEPLTVSFAGSAIGGTPPYSYAWSFGDGLASTNQNPTHVFASAGPYDVTLAVTDGEGRSATDTRLAIRVAHTLSASTTASAGGGVSPLAVSFHSAVSGGTPPYTYAWSFGDGGASPEADPDHTYSTAGVRNVALSVTDARGRTGYDDHLQVIITPPPPVITKIKVGTPFKLVVTGSNFQQGCYANINGALWSHSTLKSTTKLQITGGRDLKQLIPKGTVTQISIVNPDGGVATTSFKY